MLQSTSTVSAGILFATFARSLLDPGPTILVTPWGLSILGGFIIAGFVFGLAKCLDFFWLEPAARDADVITAAMRHLYHTMFGSEAGHRITFLAQRFSHSRYIRPRYRYAYGSGGQLRSRSRFSHGSALAGMAWGSPGGANNIFVREIPDFGDDEEAFLNFMRTELNLSSKEVDRLSSTTRQCRWIFCYGIVHPFSGDFVGVISIDSRHQTALSRVDTDSVLGIAAIIASIVRPSL